MAERKISTRIELKGDKEFKRRMRGVAQEVKTFGDWASVTKGILGSQVIQKSLQVIGDYFKKAWDASVDFETAMAGIAKTTDLSAVQLEAMGDQIKALSERIPVSTTELAGLVEAAGQLGIADEYLMSFAETMAALGVSTNLSANDAATALAQMANIMQTAGKDYERMGSSIVALGNTSATTEKDIVEMSQRLAGAARVVRMSEAQVFGYATALTSVGINAEAGGSAMSKMWGDIETMVALGSDKLDDWAKVAGMSAEQFADAWSGDASGAFKAFVDGLAAGDKQGKSAIVTLSALGVKERRTTRAILGLATAGDLLERSLSTSEAAWEENTALATEAGLRYGTTASQIQIAENAINNLNIAVGDKFKPLVTEIAGMGAESAKALEAMIAGHKTLATMIDGVEESYKQQALSLTATAGQADALVDRLEELGDATRLTGTDQQEYLATLGLIKQIMPAAAGAIDLETGAIEGGTGALRANIEAGKKNAAQLMELDAAKNRYDALTIAQENLAQKRALYTIAISDESAAQAQLNALIERQNELFAAAVVEADEMSKSGGLFVSPDVLLQSNAEWLALDGNIRAASDALGAASGKASALNADIAAEAEALENAGAYADDYAEKLAAMGKAMEAVAGGEGMITESAQRQINEFQAMGDRLTELQDQLISATDETRKSVDKMIDGIGRFEIIELSDGLSADPTELIEGLQSQIEFMAQYEQNLQKARDLGLSDALLQELSDGELGSANVLQAIVNDGGENIDKLNEKFAEVSIGKDALATAMADAQTAFTTKSGEIIAATNEMVDNFNQEAEANKAAAATIQGVIDGMNSKLLVLTQKSNQIKRLINVTDAGGNPGTPHAAGIAYVPTDGYFAMLHRGEMVLTALEAKAYRAEQFANYGMPAIARAEPTPAPTRTIHNSSAVNLAGANIYLNDKLDIRALSMELTAQNTAQQRALGRVTR